MKPMIYLRAAARITPHIAAHQARRIARNRLAPRWADAYVRRLDRLIEEMPPLRPAVPLPPGLAGFISPYYRKSEREMADAARGRFTHLGATVDFGDVDAIDWYHGLPQEKDHHLWRMKLTQLEILHSLIASGEPHHQHVALALLRGFDRAAGFSRPGAFQNIWAPYGASHRILAIVSGMALAAEKGGMVGSLREALFRFVRRDAAFLRDNVEHDLRNNHTERNLAALCLYHMAAETISAAAARRLDREVDAIVRQTVLEDGMQIERSAMYQGLTVMALRIFAAAPFLSRATRERARQRGEAAARAWLLLTHEDGDIALFNDSWVDEVPRAAIVLPDGVARRGRTASLPQAGFMRLQGEAETVWMDVGAIGPSWNPGHGHADFLAIEADIHGRRFLVDPGTSQYSTGPGRAFERAAASHNGPRFLGEEPVEYSGCFKVGRMAAARPLGREELARLGMAAIGGVLATPTGAVRRIAMHIPGSGVLVVDHWAHEHVRGAVRLLIPALWSLESVGGKGIVASNGRSCARLLVLRGRLGPVGHAQWCRQYMRPEPAHAIELRPEALGGGQASAFLIGDRLAPVGLLDHVLGLALAGRSGQDKGRKAHGAPRRI